MSVSRWLRIGVLVLLTGCAGYLLPSPPPTPRYFAPTEPPPPPAVDDPAPIGVRLLAVRTPVHLREQIVWRRSDVEYGFYEQRRWTEQPSAYVERALARELFAVERIPREVASGSPVVTADVLTFEEVREPAHEARVEIAADLLDGRCLLLRQRFAASRPLADDDPSNLARAMGEALADVAHQTGRAIRAALDGPRRCS